MKFLKKRNILTLDNTEKNIKNKSNSNFKNMVKEKIKTYIDFLLFVYKNYNDANTKMLAVSLTYFSLLALFPILSLILGVTKGFGLDKLFIQQLLNMLPENNEILFNILNVTNNLLKTVKSGVLAGIGVIILITSVIKLLMMLEKAFNNIWKVNKKRPYFQKLINGIAVIFIVPLALVIFMSSNETVISYLNNGTLKNTHMTIILFRILNPFIFTIMFTLMFYYIPNTIVKFKSALISGIITLIFCEILKIIFLTLQGSINRYNAIYGSLSFIPIFLIWVQYFWVTILIGCQICYSIDASYQFIYGENKDILTIKQQKEIFILVLYIIIERFKKSESPYTVLDISSRLGLHSYLVKKILVSLENLGYINEIVDEEKEESTYQLGYNPDKLRIKDFVEKYENYQDIEIVYPFKKLQEDDLQILKKIRKELYSGSEELIYKV